MRFGNSAWRQLLACFLTLGCLLLPGTSLAVEPAREFLDGLRQRGYHDLAQEYLDQMKTSRPFSSGSLSNEELISGGYLDANGWPTTMPPGGEPVSTFFAWADFQSAEAHAGVYVLDYEGEGIIDLPGVTVQVRTPFVSLIFTPLDNQTLRESVRILVTAMARDKQTGTVYSPDGSRLVKAGQPPLLLEPVQATITLVAQVNGKRRDEKPKRPIAELAVQGLSRIGVTDAGGSANPCTGKGCLSCRA